MSTNQLEREGFEEAPGDNTLEGLILQIALVKAEVAVDLADENALKDQAGKL